nr:uncharacterized protein LOC107393227 isoform X1 [Nothobranchius furzeri]XP_054586070.1 uncharacterized protein LOC107393227 isoform X1 [Nothobranchius furzeri]
MWLWILIGSDFISKLYGYQNGRFPEACDSMLPQHRGSGGTFFPPQTSEPPFAVSYELGQNTRDPVKVTLKSKDSRKFTGFMLQARESSLGGKGPPVGKFISLDTSNTYLLTCGGLSGSSVSQANSQPKSLFSVNWTAQGEERDIIFRATFSQSFTMFWENVGVEFLRPTSTLAPSPTEPTVASSTASSIASSTTASTASSTGGSSTASSASHLTSAVTDTTVSTTETDFQVVSISLMCLDCVLEGAKTKISLIITVSFASRSRCFPYKHIKMSVVVFCTLCVANSICSLVLLVMTTSYKVSFAALAGAVLGINLIEFVIALLPLGPSHELNEVLDLFVQVCSVLHHVCSNALIFLGVISSMDDRGEIMTTSWRLYVMAMYTGWMFLSLVWDVGLTANKGRIKQMCKKDNSQGSGPQKYKSVVQVFITGVSVMFLVGTTAFSVAVTVGLFVIQKN